MYPLGIWFYTKQGKSRHAIAHNLCNMTYIATVDMMRMLEDAYDGIWTPTGQRSDVTWVSWCPKSAVNPLTMSQCTLAGPVFTGMPLECHWLTQCTLGYHWATQRILAGHTGTPLEKRSWNSPTLECHWIILVESAPHWDATGETLTFAAYTGRDCDSPLTPRHIVKHAE